MNFLYFALVIGFTMLFMHPLSLAVSLTASLVYSVSLHEKRDIRFGLLYMLPTALAAALINPAFNHAGVTVLAYLPSGNPLTLESIAYGIAAAAMLASVMVWFSCYTAVMTSDKFIYLFGRLLPSASLVLSMALRFVPGFIDRFHAVCEAQRCAGRTLSGGSLRGRLKNAAAIFSIMVTWVMESAAETADSMKSRGYGLPGRTAFSIYRFDGRDKAALIWLLLCGVYLTAGRMAGGLEWRYYPALRGAPADLFSVSLHLVYLALCLTPVILNRREERLWKRSSSGT